MAAKPVQMSLFKPVFLDQRVILSPTEFRAGAKDITGFLLKKIKADLEGQCCAHGYVRPGSTQIVARSMGQAEHGRYTGDFLYTCRAKVLCFLPQADQIVEARVLKTNKSGMYALLVEGGRVREAMRILLPKDLPEHIANEEFDELTVGKGIRVRVLRSRFQTRDSFIQAVGIYEGLAPGADAKPGEEEKPEEPAAAPAAEEGGLTIAAPALGAAAANGSAPAANGGVPAVNLGAAAANGGAPGAAEQAPA
jgi:DNA-directed RNA polymerase subunit E'/Rpb7